MLCLFTAGVVSWFHCQLFIPLRGRADEVMLGRRPIFQLCFSCSHQPSKISTKLWNQYCAPHHILPLVQLGCSIFGWLGGVFLNHLFFYYCFFFKCMLASYRKLTSASTLAPWRHFCYLTHMLFVESVKCAFSHTCHWECTSCTCALKLLSI